MKDLALIGKAGSGKDTVGRHLVDQYGYTRVAFADALKDAALELDPIIHVQVHFAWEEEETRRLSDVVNAVGWDRAKNEYPEVRRVLQALGQSVRRLDPDFWINIVRDRLYRVDGPAVVTDVRYTNEAQWLTSLGFTLVRVTRTGVRSLDHISETELDGYPVSLSVDNSSTINSLLRQVDNLVKA